MVKGYVGEIFNSIQGEGILVGRRQIFIRFAGCSLRCFYCDSKEYRNFKPSSCKVERSPGGEVSFVSNPISHEEVLEHVERLRTPDLHSVSLTGGEPLESRGFLVEVAAACKNAGLRIYLETNGGSCMWMRRVLPYLDFVSLDIKLPDHRAVPRHEWPKLFGEEIECARIASSGGVEVFVKVVVTRASSLPDFERVCDVVAELDLPLVLQPVDSRKKSPLWRKIFTFSGKAAERGVKEIAIIPQVHKLVGMK